MQKLESVEKARVLMTEGQDWSVWRWLLEKRRVREAADQATADLAEANKRAKALWSDALKTAYAALAEEPGRDGSRPRRTAAKTAKHGVDQSLLAAARRVKEADDEAQRATDDAEALFAEAERKLSGGIARDAARKALESYDLREAAIRKSEAARRSRA